METIYEHENSDLDEDATPKVSIIPLGEEKKAGKFIHSSTMENAKLPPVPFSKKLKTKSLHQNTIRTELDSPM
jgi:hypothetical protein